MDNRYARQQAGNIQSVNDLFASNSFIYDYLRPTTNQELYFTVPVSGTKSYTYTNMQQAGQIPFSENFWVTGIVAAFLQNYQVFPTSGRTAETNWEDMEAMLLGNYKLKRGSVTELYGSLKNICQYREHAVISPYSSASADTIYNSIGSIFGDAIGYRKYDEPFVLTPKFNFQVEVQWEAIPTYATNAFHLGIILVGKRLRVTQ